MGTGVVFPWGGDSLGGGGATGREQAVRFAGRAFARQADGSLHGLSLFHERYAASAVARYFLGQGT